MERREQLADTAAKVARRIRYVETRSVSLCAGIGVLARERLYQDIGGQPRPGAMDRGGPCARANDLVNESRKGGYEVRIGIDELDKLASGKDAEKFLTGIKILFPIRDCWILVTVSEDAAAQFAMRGMPDKSMFKALSTLL